MDIETSKSVMTVFDPLDYVYRISCRRKDTKPIEFSVVEHVLFPHFLAEASIDVYPLLALASRSSIVLLIAETVPSSGSRSLSI